MIRRHPIELATALVVTVAAFVALNMSPLGAGNGTYVPPIDNGNRAQVAATYRTSITRNLGLSAGWTGSTSSCRAGSASDTYDAATIESINWFRRMSGLTIVTEDAQASGNAQQTALMMHAQNNLSHFPGTSWKCHTAAGASTAAVSNLTLGVVGPRGVIGQIEDPGVGNEALGHRRWLLFPELESVGIANTTRASVVRVIGDFGPRESSSDWVSWPPPGFVPDETVFDRWSISYAGPGSVDFSNATVKVRENGRSVGVRVLPLSNGFGDPTLAWEVTGIAPGAPGDVVYTVDVTNVRVGGRSMNRSYSFTSFDVETEATASSYRCNGRTATIVGTPGNDVIRGTSGIDVIVALGGDDTIDALAGADIICGGAGNDLIRAGWGNDILFGGSGRDRLRGSRGNDALYGQAGRDNLEGGMGADTLVGGRHADSLTGGNGNDVCWGRQVGQLASSSVDFRICERGR
jgi:hypothetical protein